MVKCDCCGRELKDGETLHKVPLPYRYRSKELQSTNEEFSCVALYTCKTKMKNYDFCEDCYNGFGEMMYLYNESPKYFNTLFPKIALIANMLPKKGNKNVD